LHIFSSFFYAEIYTLTRTRTRTPIHSLAPIITLTLHRTDDGGSTQEIRRILGGPAIGLNKRVSFSLTHYTQFVDFEWKTGDIRSRCVRLSSDTNIYNLLIYRLDQKDKVHIAL
jgi:hypothetical protein